MYKSFLPKAVRKYSNITIKNGYGSWLYDSNNKRYLDFTSGIGVLNLGHTHQKINNAIIQQLNHYSHAQQMCLYDPKALELSKLLSTITPKDLNVTFFTPSGSEAVDASIRISRYSTNKKRILSIKKGFHGRTLGVMALTNNGIPERSSIEPFVGLCLCVENVIKYIESSEGNNIAAIIIESIQGEGGINFLPKEFTQELSVTCKKYNILLICDEIQCGLNRTGKMFAFEHSEIIPDIILVGKGLANGLPLAGVISTEEIFNKCPIGGLGGTYGGNVLSLVAAIEAVKIIKEESISRNVIEKGMYVEQYLKNLQKENSDIIDIRVYGLMIGIDLKIESKIIISECEENGLLILPTNNPNTIRFLPPLNISTSDLEWGLNKFKQTLYRHTKQRGVQDLILDADEPVFI